LMLNQMSLYNLSFDMPSFKFLYSEASGLPVHDPISYMDTILSFQ